MKKNQQNNNIVPNWDEAQNENQKPHSILLGMSGKEVQYNKELVIIYQKQSDFEDNSKYVDLLEILKTNTPDISKDAADTVINAGNLKLLLDKINDTNELKNLTKEHAEIIKSNMGTKFLINIKEIEKEVGQSKEQIIDEMLHREADIIMLNADLSKSKKVKIPLTGEVSELHVDYSNDIKSKLSPENDELLTKNTDNYFMNKIFGPILSESSKNEIERIRKEARKYSTMPFTISDEDKYMSYSITKPFFEEKYLPTEKEFKDEAKKLKVTCNFSSLGAAQNELAKRYGFKEYRAIKSRFTESSKSYDNLNTILIHTYKLNEIEHSEINDFFFKFRHIFRKLNLAIGILNQENTLDNVEPRLYDKKLESLHIQENSLIEIYNYFTNENSIVFGQIKRNINRLSTDEKIKLLIEKNEVETDKDEEVIFSNLLAYNIGKSVGDVTLVKNEDSSIGKIFKPKSYADRKVGNAVEDLLNKKNANR